MGIEIMRRISFCAGHRLYRHGGKCEFFHGHNYVAEFYVTADDVDDVGRVIDFAELKLRFKGWIDEHWDHGFILFEEDKNGIDAIRQVEPCKVFVLPYNPTAENMALYLLEHVAPDLLAGTAATASKVVVWETDQAFAAVTASDIRPRLVAEPAAEPTQHAKMR
jgi:6-pyruvoyltetrahydropterin/6-carboxytetrahydropterin synthase